MNLLFVTYNSNYLITDVLKPRHDIFSRRFLWSNLLDFFWRSTKIMPVRIPLSMAIKIKSVKTQSQLNSVL